MTRLLLVAALLGLGGQILLPAGASAETASAPITIGLESTGGEAGPINKVWLVFGPDLLPERSRYAWEDYALRVSIKGLATPISMQRRLGSLESSDLEIPFPAIFARRYSILFVDVALVDPTGEIVEVASELLYYVAPNLGETRGSASAEEFENRRSRPPSGPCSAAFCL